MILMLSAVLCAVVHADTEDYCESLDMESAKPQGIWFLIVFDKYISPSVRMSYITRY